jgi:hypothetical protein
MPRVVTFPEQMRNLKVRTIRDFERHEIKRRGPRHWICKEPGTSHKWYGVVMGPSMVTIYGDIGDLILRPYTAGRDPLGWVRGVCGSPDSPFRPDYPLGKAPHSQDATEFSADSARDELKELEDQLKADTAEDKAEQEELHPGEPFVLHADHFARRKQLEDIRSQWDGETEYSWHEACHDNDYDEPGTNHVWTSEALWCYQALCWLAQHLGPDGEVM